MRGLRWWLSSVLALFFVELEEEGTFRRGTSNREVRVVVQAFQPASLLYARMVGRMEARTRMGIVRVRPLLSVGLQTPRENRDRDSQPRQY